MDHTVVHFEIPADDLRRAAAFYRELFGWEIQKWEPAGEEHEGTEYWLVSTVPSDEQGRPTRAGVNGGMMPRQHPGHAPVNYFSVESVDDYANKVVKLGGKVVVPKTPVPGMGQFAWVTDTEGNTFALWEMTA
jgi:predicted enzyme related to lactoylglutathione lyase